MPVTPTSTRRPSRRAARGLTMLELIVVLAVLAIIAVIAIPRLSDVIRGGQIRRGVDNVRHIGNLSQYLARLDNRRTPSAADMTKAVADTPGTASRDLTHGAARDGTAVAVVEFVEKDERYYLARTSYGRTTAWWEDAADCSPCDLAHALGGPPEGTAGSGDAGVGGIPSLVVFGLFTGGGGTMALDDARVTSSYGSTGTNLFLQDDFNAANGPVDSSTAPSYLTSDTAVNNGPLLGGGTATGVWYNPLTFEGAGTPVRQGGKIVPSGNNSIDQVAWDFSSDDFESSWRLVQRPTGTASAMLFDIDVTAFLPTAAVEVTSGGASLVVNQIGGDGTVPDGMSVFVARNVSVPLGSRVGLRRRGTTYSLVIDNQVRASVDLSAKGALSGSVSGVADPSACYANTLPSGQGPSSTPLNTEAVGADGTFKVGASSNVPVRVRINCPEGQRWAGNPVRTDADWSQAPLFTVTGGTATAVGAVSYP